MKYNNLGKAGIKVSELAFGSWLTFGKEIDQNSAKTLMRKAFDCGVNFFDNAEVYGEGQSEVIMGQALKDFRREDLVISTKIFWGGKGPNDEGLSRKHIIEGTRNSLKRMQLEYVDLLFCHRPDPRTPIEETVRAMDYIVRQGQAFYWGTSEWPAALIEEAYLWAAQLECVPPVMEQPQYNMLARERFEREYAPLFKKYGLGTTIWSPLASGILSGKYADGIPKASRLSQHAWLRDKLTPKVNEVVKQIAKLASEVGCSMAQLSIAWCLKNVNVSSVILGATNLKQLEENLNAASVRDKLTPELMAKINSILTVLENES